MLAGSGELLDFDPELLADLKTAVSEACNNVVLHAYDDEPGPLIVRLEAHPEAVEVIVEDRGCGFDAAEHTDEPFGVGLAVIRALAADVEVTGGEDGGTLARMEFARRRAHLPQVRGSEIPASLTTSLAAHGEVVVSVAPVELLAGVLGRIAGCVAAEAHFSIDRYSDLYLVTDGIAAHARSHARGDQMTAALAARPREIDLTIGPFAAGTTSELQRRDGVDGPLLARLVDGVDVEPYDDSEAMRLMLIDRRSDAAGMSA
jgi:anti-sigma regulatory factor (Ser/Thr protein kinase)